MYKESPIYSKQIFICGWTFNILAKSSNKRVSILFQPNLKILIQPNRTKNKETPYQLGQPVTVTY
jgi:hypothetical protein